MLSIVILTDLAILALLGFVLFYSVKRNRPVRKVQETMVGVPVSTLRHLARRNIERANCVAKEVGPNSLAEHLEHVATRYNEAAEMGSLFSEKGPGVDL